METNDFKDVVDGLIDVTDSSVSDLLTRGKEDDTGHIEYKYRLTALSEDQKDHLAGQMKFRLANDDEFNGQAIYDIGLTDDGFALGLNEDEMSESLGNLREIVSRAGAKICNVRRETVTFHAESETELLKKYMNNLRHKFLDTDSADQKRRAVGIVPKEGLTEFTRHVAEVLIRKHDSVGDYLELRIGVVGSVDAGKSSIIGVLTHGALDNGRGSARATVANFKHEIETGRTSSIAQQIMGFNDKGQSVNDGLTLKKPTWDDIVKASTKVITFFDLAGHAKYLRTTINGMTSNRPDYAMIMVGSNMGITDMTIEHVNLCLTLHIPFVVIMTKIDIAPVDIIATTFKRVDELIKKNARKLTYKIKTEDDVMQCAKKMTSGDLVPIFFVSNVTGEGMSLLKLFLNYLPMRRSYRKVSAKPPKMQVQEIFTVPGAGTIVGGMLTSGTLRLQDNLLLGPTSTGEFIPVRVRSMECKKTPVTEISAGRYACVGLPGVDKSIIKKGMFLMDPKWDPKAVWEFTASIYVNSTSSSNIKVGYHPYCHIGHIRQSCEIIEFIEIRNGKKILKPSTSTSTSTSTSGETLVSPEVSFVPPETMFIGARDTAVVKMRFCFKPEVVFDENKSKFIFRENKTRGIGMITSTNEEAVYEPEKSRKVRRERNTRNRAI